MPLCKIFIQRSCMMSSSAGVAIHCSGLFCKEVSRSYGAKEAFSFQASLPGILPYRECAVFVSCFFFSTLAHTSFLMSGGSVHASKYSFSTLVGPQTSGDRYTCVVQFRIQFGSMSRSSPNWACVFSRGVRQCQCCCSNSAWRYNPIWSLITSSGGCFGWPTSSLCCVCAFCSSGLCPR